MERRIIELPLFDLTHRYNAAFSDAYDNNKSRSMNTIVNKLNTDLVRIMEDAARDGRTEIFIKYGAVFEIRQETDKELQARIDKQTKAATTRRQNFLKANRLPNTKEYKQYKMLERKFRPIEKAIEEEAALVTE